MWIDSHLETAENNKRVNLLKDLMSQLKLTKTGCAKMLDINERTVYRWLSGERQVPIIVLSLLRAELLLRKHGISIEQDGCVG
jgi:DNA-binding transcriptional regulator YiaG